MKLRSPTVITFKQFSRCAIALFVCILLASCSNLLFYPTKQWQRTPKQLGLVYRDLSFLAKDGVQLSGWWLDAVGDAKGTVLFLHGNAENISTHLGSVYWLPEKGYQVMMLDYRGYGRSQGAPSLPAVFNDIEAAFTWLRQEPAVGQKPVFLLAQSLGASLGGYVVSNQPSLRSQLDAVVLDAGFTSYSDIARDVASRHWSTWLLQYPAAWSMPGAYDLQDYIGQISPTPLLIIHGTQDEVIPFSYAETLFESAGKPKSFLRYDGPHIGTFLDLENRELMLEFFESSTKGKKNSGGRK